jgi:D-arabinose 1-dehydrogenase-like Zn-dependent alcohol dehydrogenase
MYTIEHGKQTRRSPDREAPVKPIHCDPTNRSQNAVEELIKLGGAKVILATVPSGKAMTEILGGLAVNGKLVIIGASDEPIQVPTSLMILGRRSLIGWPSGTSIDSQDTLSFSVLSGVRSMNEVFPLERAAEAYDHNKCVLDILCVGIF